MRPEVRFCDWLAPRPKWGSRNEHWKGCVDRNKLVVLQSEVLNSLVDHLLICVLLHCELLKMWYSENSWHCDICIRDVNCTLIWLNHLLWVEAQSGFSVKYAILRPRPVALSVLCFVEWHQILVWGLGVRCVLVVFPNNDVNISLFPHQAPGTEVRVRVASTMSGSLSTDLSTSMLLKCQIKLYYECL